MVLLVLVLVRVLLMPDVVLVLVLVLVMPGVQVLALYAISHGAQRPSGISTMTQIVRPAPQEGPEIYAGSSSASGQEPGNDQPQEHCIRREAPWWAVATM